MWFLWMILGMVILAGVEVGVLMFISMGLHEHRKGEKEHVADMMPPEEINLKGDGVRNETR